MLMNALILAGLSAVGLIFVFKKMPKNVQEFLLKHPLLTELLTFLATYATLGGSLTALFAGSIVSTVTTILLHVRDNPQDYEGIIAGGEWLSQQGSLGLKSLNKWLVTTLKVESRKAEPRLVA